MAPVSGKTAGQALYDASEHCLQIQEHFNPLNAELNPTRHLLALVGARHIVHVSSIRINVRRLLIVLW